MPNVSKKEIPVNLRVLLIDLSKRYGGASVRALTLASHMVPEAAIAGLEDSPVIKIAKERNIPTRIVGKSRLDPRIPFRLREIIRQDGYQIIDSQNIQSKFWGSLAAFISDVAFVATLNSSYADEQGGSLKGKLYAMIDHATNFKTDRYIAVSDSIQKNLLQTGISGGMVDLVTNAVELADFAQAGDAVRMRGQLGIPEDAVVCASVGRLVWAKGFDDFVTAFACVAEPIPNAYGLILGEGPLRPALSEQIKAAGLENRVILLGHCEQPKVFSILKASDVFVMTSRSEGVPFALLEAAAIGLPIIATYCGGIPEVLEDNVNALLAPVGDASAIAAGIVRLCRDRQFAQRLGSEAREKIRRDYNIQKQIEATRNTYRKALEHKQLRRNARPSSTSPRGDF